MPAVPESYRNAESKPGSGIMVERNVKNSEHQSRSWEFEWKKMESELGGILYILQNYINENIRYHTRLDTCGEITKMFSILFTIF